jgi:hypothetical protein
MRQSAKTTWECGEVKWLRTCEEKKVLIVTKGQARIASVVFPDERGMPKLAEAAARHVIGHVLWLIPIYLSIFLSIRTRECFLVKLRSFGKLRINMCGFVVGERASGSERQRSTCSGRNPLSPVGPFTFLKY